MNTTITSFVMSAVPSSSLRTRRLSHFRSRSLLDSASHSKTTKWCFLDDQPTSAQRLNASAKAHPPRGSDSLPASVEKRPVALVDIGSSSIQITVARVHDAGIETIDRAKFNAKLRVALDRNGRLTDDVMDHVIEKLMEYRQLADQHCAPVKATATATLRAATNMMNSLNASKAIGWMSR